jgi:NAD(P)-dependent dehydrogenase (short-subunit alcohol dehydrogenase family)
MIVKPRVCRVIVTGGSSGIGFAIARRLISEGCTVYLVGRDEEKLMNAKLKLQSSSCFIMPHDITDIDKFDELVSECSKIGGPVDGLINCAGIKSNSVCEPGIRETEDGYSVIMKTNLMAPVFMTRQFASYLKENGISGNILNISSAQGAAVKTTSAYQMAKSSLIKFTRGIAKDFAQYGIVINGIAPGCTYSAMTPKNKGGENKLHANRRTLEASEQADVACFLLSELACGIIGDTIFCDGGFLGAL